MEKPFGTDLATRPGAQRVAPRDLRRGADLPHRPLPRQGGGAEHPRLPLRQRPVRADLEPRPHRPRADRRARDARRSSRASAFYEKTGAYRDMVVTHLFQVLAFMAMEPPTALEPGAISEEKNKVFRSMRPIEPANVVRGQYGGYRDEPGVAAALRHRDVHRPAVRDRQLALGRRAVLPAHRQAHGRGRAHHLDRLPRAAQEHVPGRLRRRRRTAPTTSPSTWPTRRSCRCRSTASGPGRA